MKIAEIFLSVQGEGPQVGMISWFIRTSGCNLSCNWCDSKYANEGKEMSISEIIDSLPPNECNNVVITGGEPLLQKDLLELLSCLPHKIYVETNGTIYDSKLIGMATYIVSPKLQFMNDAYMETLKKWKYQGTFKFVIGSRKDFDDALKLCKELKLEQTLDPVYFMPKGTDQKTINTNIINIVEWLKKDAPWGRVSLRLHITLYGNKRGV